MIKFIASDIDGTLTQIPLANYLDEEMYKTIQRCLAKDIKFVAASGRNYANMKKMFLPVWRDIYFVSDNGSCIMHEDEILHQVIIPTPLVVEIAQYLDTLPDCAYAFSTARKLLIPEEPRDFADTNIYGAHNAAIIINSLDEVYEEDIIKISTCHPPEIIYERDKYLQEKWGDKLEVAIAGNNWIDITLTNKGAALRRLFHDFDIDHSQAMVFGDNFNDVGMLSAVDYSFAMVDADEGVRAHANYETYNVGKVIEHYLATGEVKSFPRED